jgi:hypothetical protein
MATKTKLNRLKGPMLDALEQLFDMVEELNVKCRDLDQKVEYLIQKKGNGQNHC